MQRMETNTACAGCDVGKARIDAATIAGETTSVSNDGAGIAALIAWLRARAVTRVGLEASGGYERALTRALVKAGFETIVHQPLEVRLFARLTRAKAKNDRLDAALIAAVTAAQGRAKPACDRDLGDLAERFTAYDQVSGLIAQLKTMIEHVHLADLVAAFRAEIAALAKLKAKIAAAIVAEIKARPALAARFDLLRSLPGIGPIVAAALVVRMPELGTMARGQAAALVGVAPFDRDSGQHKGARRIAGGRARPRRLLYMAALAAKRCDPALKAFAQGLAARGKPVKLVLVAIMRKLIETANLILARGTPWRSRAPA